MDKDTAIQKIWTSIFKGLSGKKTSYAMGGMAYPKNTNWTRTKYEKLYILLEDPSRPPGINTDPVFDASLDFKHQNDQLSVDFNLTIELPITVDITEVLAILDHPYIGQFPSLTIQNTHRSGKRYCIHIDNSCISRTELGVYDIVTWINHRLDIIDHIVEVLYKIEKAPQNNNLFAELKNWLVEI